ncbi:MAG TPA: hypothetical protein VNT53_02225 [Pseudolysinimonas sp.]|nr:hypothetical protein [Pseudolysinimonas sp.]
MPAQTSPSSHSAVAPTPTAAAASAPGSRVPLGCTELLGTSALTTITGATPHAYHDESTAPTNIRDIAQDQYGALNCAWFQPDNTIAGAGLQLVVAPNAKAAFMSRFAAIMADQSLSAHPVASENIAGDKSGFWCADVVDALGADFTLPICISEMLVSGYWVSLEVDTVNGLSRSQLVAAVPTAMKDIATRIKAAGRAPAQWVAPATTPPGFCTASTSTAIVRSIFGDSTLAAATTPSTSTAASTIGLVGPYASCDWNGKSYGYLQIRLLAGGSWAFPSFAPVPTGDSIFTAQDYSAIAVAGSTSAKEACVSGGCHAFLAVGSSAVEVAYNDPGVAKRASVLAAFAKALTAS